MRAAHFGALLAVTLLAGCSSHPEIPVSDQQSLVMESNVLAAGISAEVPTVTCLLYTSDAADDMQCVDLGGRRRLNLGCGHRRYFSADARCQYV